MIILLFQIVTVLEHKTVVLDNRKATENDIQKIKSVKRSSQIELNHPFNHIVLRRAAYYYKNAMCQHKPLLDKYTLCVNYLWMAICSANWYLKVSFFRLFCSLFLSLPPPPPLLTSLPLSLWVSLEPKEVMPLMVFDLSYIVCLMFVLFLLRSIATHAHTNSHALLVCALFSQISIFRLIQFDRITVKYQFGIRTNKHFLL